MWLCRDGWACFGGRCINIQPGYHDYSSAGTPVDVEEYYEKNLELPYSRAATGNVPTAKIEDLVFMLSKDSDTLAIRPPILQQQVALGPTLVADP